MQFSIRRKKTCRRNISRKESQGPCLCLGKLIHRNGDRIRARHAGRKVALGAGSRSLCLSLSLSCSPCFFPLVTLSLSVYVPVSVSFFISLLLSFFLSLSLSLPLSVSLYLSLPYMHMCVHLCMRVLMICLCDGHCRETSLCKLASSLLPNCWKCI